ncbi:MAG: imidazole glycerol phosphate synthase subunit HisF [Betaproteobacteria bacterium]|nr:imidazole glycerol phosphate synthase subunit HisF [Betaproteobacteria bacterium]
MLKTRLVAVLILADGRVVQSVRFKHTNAIHYDPIHAIECFNKWAVDEIVMLNVSRNPDSRSAFSDAVGAVSSSCFVPLSAGGWIDDEDFAANLLSNGADKLVINTALADSPELVSRLSARYGAQCIVASMDVKRDDSGDTHIVVDRGSRVAFNDPVSWACQAEALGAGEIFFNSVDHDGARKGYNLDILQKICSAVRIPVIAFGGVFSWQHLVEGVHVGASAVAAANIFHYTEHSTKKAKRYLAQAGILVRNEGQTKV